MANVMDRAREEELVYVLRKLLDLRLWHGSLWAAFSDNPTSHSTSQPCEYKSHAEIFRISDDVCTSRRRTGAIDAIQTYI
jgi:hypothetical protein